MNRFVAVLLLSSIPLLVFGEGGLRPLPRNYYRVFIGIGLSGNWTLDGPRQVWVDRTTGFGFLQGFGSTIRAERPLTKWINLTLETGYQHWQVKRERQHNNFILASTYKRLRQIPLIVGAKFFTQQSWYIAPQIGLNHLTLAEWADGTTQNSQEAVGVLGSLRIGREIRMGHGWLDISGGFEYSPIYKNPVFGEPFRYLSVQVIWKKGWVKPIRCP